MGVVDFLNWDVGTGIVVVWADGASFRFVGVDFGDNVGGVFFLGFHHGEDWNFCGGVGVHAFEFEGKVGFF